MQSNNKQIPPKPNYKLTKLGWIPEEWYISEFGKEFEFIKTFSFSRAQLSDSKTKNEIQYIHYGDIHSTFNNEILDFEKEQSIPYLNDGLISNECFEIEDSPTLQDGDLIIADASEDYEGICDCVELRNINGKKVVSGLHTFAARANKESISVGFRTYILKHQHVIKELRKIATGISVYGISKTNLSKLKIPLPPLPEQKAIAHCLSTWDKAINTLQKLIGQKQARKKWLMQVLLTSKIRMKGFEKTKWQLKSIFEISSFRNGKGHEKQIVENGKYIVVNSKFISSEGKTIKRSNSFLCPLKKNEIVMVLSDIPNGKALSKCFFVDKNNTYTLNQRICALSVFDNMNSIFIYYLINRNHHFLSFNDGVSQTNLRKDDVLDCPLFLPSKEEQTAIANVLQTADKEIGLLQQKLEKLRKQKKGLMQVLLTGKKRLV